MQDKHYYVYIMSNRNKTLYTGMTNNLIRRVYQHKHRLINGFTKRYNITNLIYYEEINDVWEALCREKKIKGWLRSKKIALIESVNPEWKDLSEDWDFTALSSSPPRIVILREAKRRRISSDKRAKSNKILRSCLTQE